MTNDILPIRQSEDRSNLDLRYLSIFISQWFFLRSMCREIKLSSRNVAINGVLSVSREINKNLIALPICNPIPKMFQLTIKQSCTFLSQNTCYIIICSIFGTELFMFNKTSLFYEIITKTLQTYTASIFST